MTSRLAPAGRHHAPPAATWSYSELLTEIARTVHPDDPAARDRVVTDEFTYFNDIAMAFERDDDEGGGESAAIVVFLDLGRPPAGRETAFFESLLHKQLTLLRGLGPVVGCEAGTGRALLRARLDGRLVGNLGEMLTLLTDLARDLLQEPDDPQPAMAQPLQADY